MTGRGHPDLLARSTPADLEIAWRHRERLVAAAVGVAVLTGHRPGVAWCDDAGCLLAGTGDQPLCGITHRLARLAPLTAAVTAPSGPPLTVATDAFRRALTDAVDAVRTCRQTAHPIGACWFSAQPGTDGCAEVLSFAHEAG